MVAIAVLALAQLPGAVSELSLTDACTHTVEGPVIGAGSGDTVMLRVVMQPVANW